MKAPVIFALFGMLIFESSAASGPHFILLSNDNNALYRVSLPLGTPELIGELGHSGDFIELIEVDSVRLFAFERVSNTLFVLNRFDGTVVGTAVLDEDIFVSRRGFDLSPGGILYGVLPGMQLRTVNPATGGTTHIVSITGAVRVEAIAFSDSGTLFAVGSIADNSTSETLFTLSPYTGVLTAVGQIDFPDVDDLTFGSDGFLYGVNSVDGQQAHLVRINSRTAAVTDLGPTGVTGVTGLVAIRQAVRLSVSAKDGTVQLHWPSEAPGFEIEQSQSLMGHDWEPYENAPAIDGDNFVVDIPPQHEKQFFRLAR